MYASTSRDELDKDLGAGPGDALIVGVCLGDGGAARCMHDSSMSWVALQLPGLEVGAALRDVASRGEVRVVSHARVARRVALRPDLGGLSAVAAATDVAVRQDHGVPGEHVFVAIERAADPQGLPDVRVFWERVRQTSNERVSLRAAPR